MNSTELNEKIAYELEVLVNNLKQSQKRNKNTQKMSKKLKQLKSEQTNLILEINKLSKLLR